MGNLTARRLFTSPAKPLYNLALAMYHSIYDMPGVDRHDMEWPSHVITAAAIRLSLAIDIYYMARRTDEVIALYGELWNDSQAMLPPTAMATMGASSETSSSSTPPAPTTFHDFGRLPTELQMMIWEAAFDPPDCRHLFCPLGADDIESVDDQSFLFLRHGSRRRSPAARLLPDHGLWQACFLSRRVIRTAYNRHRRIVYDESFVCCTLDLPPTVPRLSFERDFSYIVTGPRARQWFLQRLVHLHNETRTLYKQLRTKGDPEGKRRAATREYAAAADCTDAYEDPQLASVLAVAQNDLDELFRQW